LFAERGCRIGEPKSPVTPLLAKSFDVARQIKAREAEIEAID
jgi:hypothetical protein